RIVLVSARTANASDGSRGSIHEEPWSSGRDGQAPSPGYAPSEYRLKPWTHEARLEGWCPCYQGASDGLLFALDVAARTKTRRGTTASLPEATADSQRSRRPGPSQCRPERVPPDVGTFGGERGRGFLDISFAERFLAALGLPTTAPPLAPARD